VSTVFSFLLSALLLLLPLQSAAQAADSGFAVPNSPPSSNRSLGATSSSPTPCSNPVLPPADNGEQAVLTTIPTSAEICVPYGDNGYIKIVTPLRPSNLITTDPPAADGFRSSDDPELEITWNCPAGAGKTNQVKAPLTCNPFYRPNSAIIKFDYDYTPSLQNEHILYATSISPSNFFNSFQPPLATLGDQALGDDLVVPVPPPSATATMICSDGTFVKPPIPCKRRS